MDQRNEFTGDAHNVVQARDIHIYAASRPAGQVVVGPVPRRPRHFQDRAQISRLSEMTGVAVLCAVTGQRGVGKTQVAGAYARQRISDGWLVAWIPAETPDSVTAGLLELADRLGLRQERNDPTTLGRLRDHLQTMTEPALLVFDNVVDPEVVVPRLPATGSAQIVLTSAFRGVERVGEPVPVDLFTAEAAVRFLAETTGLDDERGALELAEELGRLPLALTQAAARITVMDRAPGGDAHRRPADTRRRPPAEDRHRARLPGAGRGSVTLAPKKTPGNADVNCCGCLGEGRRHAWRDRRGGLMPRVRPSPLAAAARVM